MQALVRAALDLTTEHDRDRIFERMVGCAAEVAEARYAALALYDGSGHIERFVHHGLDPDVVTRIGALPVGLGLLGDVIVADRPIRLADLSAHPQAGGFPPHHPPMRSFLGVPVRIGRKRFGNLYLTEKRGGGEFDSDDERLVVTLAAFAAAAIEGALLVTVERERAEALAGLAVVEERERAQRLLLGLVIGAQEAERARVARDLHDEIGQSLTSVLLGLRLVTDSLRTSDIADALAHADEVRNLVAAALDGVRQLAFELRPTVLDDMGLVPAVRRLAGDFDRRHGVRVELVLEGVADDSRFVPELETVVYRVIQEALTNVARHAHASGAVVSLAAESACLRATIRDDGVGFDPPLGEPRSLGLAGMEERAALVGGHIEVSAAPGAGTRVALEVPIG